MTLKAVQFATPLKGKIFSSGLKYEFTTSVYAGLRETTYIRKKNQIMLFITWCLHYSCDIYTKCRLQERVNNKVWMKRGVFCYKPFKSLPRSITITNTYVQLLLPVTHPSCLQPTWKKWSGSSPDFPLQTLPTWAGSMAGSIFLTESWLSLHTACRICFILLKQQCYTSVQQDPST